MRLIDADKVRYKLWGFECYTGNDEAPYEYADNIIDDAPTVDAIPIDYIKEQIEMYDGLSNIRDDRWGDIYHTFSQLLRGLIAHWRKDMEKEK